MAHPVFKHVLTTAVHAENFTVKDRHDLRQVVRMGNADLSIPAVGQLMQGITHEEAELIENPHPTARVLNVAVNHGDVPAAFGEC